MMLTWSDWRTEPRSNRYHFATRLARNWPVLFVQMDAECETISVEDSGSPGIRLLHVPSIYDHRLAPLLTSTLLDLGFRSPMLWIYNVLFYDFIAACHSPLKIYHATEDYFVEGVTEESLLIIPKLRAVLKHVDLLIAVSPLVREHYLTWGGYVGESIVLSNGCDYAFWNNPSTPPLHESATQDRKVAFYQGGINHRLDWELLEAVIAQLPDWEFWFCGRLVRDISVMARWKRLLSSQNVRYFGELPVEEIKRLGRQATVGIIPFVASEFIYSSMPLKAFEYVACGLPVVSTPIQALEEHPFLFELAHTPMDFSAAMQRVIKTRWDATAINHRKNIASQYDYDASFEKFLNWVEKFQAKGDLNFQNCNILVLYDTHSTHVNTIKEHLRSFSLYSRHSVYYAAATGAASAADLSLFDVVVIHHCVRVNLENHLSQANYRALREFPGLKVLFIQDEYDTTEIARRAIESLGIHVVFTCVPQEFIPCVYPPKRFPAVEFVPTLTGFIPAEFRADHRPISERPILLGYRGRALPYWYGDLGREKVLIAKRMKEICAVRKLPADIEWDDSRRIYGVDWYRFLLSCKATLGTESGSNVFDEHGDVRKAIENALIQDPDASYEQLREEFLMPHEGRIRMNQISPRIFEAVLCRTALVLFEGQYSGVIKPWVHFIPLKKDFSNVNEVLDKVQDDALLEQLTERAYQDIVASGRYSYQTFVRGFDALIDKRIRKGNMLSLTSVLYAARSESGLDQFNVRAVKNGCAQATNVPLEASAEAAIRSFRPPKWEWLKSSARRLWRLLPTSVRNTLRPLINWVGSRAVVMGG
jgi:glycosyltransferase involved in cell wall biosynthesis